MASTVRKKNEAKKNVLDALNSTILSELLIIDHLSITDIFRQAIQNEIRILINR
jgi:hypothetical protein